VRWGSWPDLMLVLAPESVLPVGRTTWLSCPPQTALASELTKKRIRQEREYDLRIGIRVLGEQTASNTFVQAERVVAIVSGFGARPSDLRYWGNVFSGVELREVILAGCRLPALTTALEYPRHAPAMGGRGVATAIV
jgi:hypothetical protein